MKYLTLWTVDNPVIPVRVRPVPDRSVAPPAIRCYRTECTWMTFRPDALRTWAELMPEQKRSAYLAACDRDIADAKWATAKDPALVENARLWIKAALEKRDAAIAAIDCGEDVPPPNEEG